MNLEWGGQEEEGEGKEEQRLMTMMTMVVVVVRVTTTTTITKTNIFGTKYKKSIKTISQCNERRNTHSPVAAAVPVAPRPAPRSARLHAVAVPFPPQTDAVLVQALRRVSIRD